VRDRGAAAETAFDLALAFNRMLGEKLGRRGQGALRPGAQRLGGNLVPHLRRRGAAEGHRAALPGLGLPLAEGYGLTEAAPVLSVAKAKRGGKPAPWASPIPGVEIKILNPDARGVGEVLARGPNVMVGYADNPEATALAIDADGWLHTGDLGFIDRKATELTLVGRSKDVIVNASGREPLPRRRRARPRQHRGRVKELVVLGVDDPKGGERAALLAVPDTEGLAGDERQARPRPR
jgi:long-chain acyl-CoA synthetase